MSNDVRELMLLFGDQDLGKTWELDNAVKTPETYQLASDIVLYASPHAEAHCAT